MIYSKYIESAEKLLDVKSRTDDGKALNDVNVINFMINIVRDNKPIQFKSIMVRKLIKNLMVLNLLKFYTNIVKKWIR